LFDNFYAECSAEVTFDTSRAWCGWMPAVVRLFPDAKVIACVRELPWVVDSIERLIQHNVFSPSSIFNYSAGGMGRLRDASRVGQERKYAKGEAPPMAVGGPVTRRHFGADTVGRGSVGGLVGETIFSFTGSPYPLY
jgi:hypothetical protein